MWMSQQSEPVVGRWRAEGLDPLIRERTGLGNDSFFFGSKLAWLLEQSPTVAAAAAADDLAVGTVDSWLIYRAHRRRRHRTDMSNGSRSQLMNLRSTRVGPASCARRSGSRWAACPSCGRAWACSATTDPDVCGAEIPITGDIADQQASLFGHGCEEPGSMKATFGTSGVVALNTGADTFLPATAW